MACPKHGRQGRIERATQRRQEAEARIKTKIAAHNETNITAGLGLSRKRIALAREPLLELLANIDRVPRQGRVQLDRLINDHLEPTNPKRWKVPEIHGTPLGI